MPILDAVLIRDAVLILGICGGVCCQERCERGVGKVKIRGGYEVREGSCLRFRNSACV